MDNAAGIFISYRRQEANYLAGWLHDCLTDHFGEARVFLDIDWIRPGVDFMEVIRQGIASSGALLVIIGPHWLTGGPDGDGRRRLDETNDPVRVEIETALRHDLRIIPLLLDDTVMPEPGDLPVGLARLADLNALRVRYETFRADVDRLVRILDEEIGTAPTTKRTQAEPRSCPVLDVERGRPSTELPAGTPGRTTANGVASSPGCREPTAST